MRVWRIASSSHAAFDGEGARRHGSRWTPRGRPAIYTSATLSLAALERFVHADADLQPANLVSIAVDIGDGIGLDTVEHAGLPSGWRTYPPPESLQSIGERWLRDAATAVLSVPSVVVPHERNYVLNPNHADFDRLTIGRPAPFSFDPRMWKPQRRR